MMKRESSGLYIITLVLLLSTKVLLGQSQTSQIRVGQKTITFLLEDKVSVRRNVIDSIISCDSSKIRQLPLGSNTASILINPADIKIFKREVFNENGCIWTRLTNDIAHGNYKAEYTTVTFLNDSAARLKRPKICWAIDSIYSINPVTMEEELDISIDSFFQAKYHLGNIGKETLRQAIIQKLDLDKNSPKLILRNLELLVVNRTCNLLAIDFRTEESVQKALVEVGKISADSQIMIAGIQLENSGGRIYDGWWFRNVAIMTLAE